MGTIINIAITVIGIFTLIVILSGIRIVRPIEEGIVERLGKYRATKTAGFRYIIPVIETMRKVNITERMVDIEPQTVITKDNLNAQVDAVVYFKVKDTKASLYQVDNHVLQLSSLARTTLRAVIGKMSLSEANEERDRINTRVEEILDKETKSYGVEVLRVEIQRIQPPRDVQETMNEVVKAERKRIASSEIANALEIEADGQRRAEIKNAEGFKQARILEAQGKAESIKLENEALLKWFRDNAIDYKKLETTRDSLINNSKVVLTSDGVDPVIVLGEDKITPLTTKRGEVKKR